MSVLEIPVAIPAETKWHIPDNIKCGHPGFRHQSPRPRALFEPRSLPACPGTPAADGCPPPPAPRAVIIPNFVGAKVGCLAITEENKGLLRCGYSRRRPDELAVLTRWFPESLVEVREPQPPLPIRRAAFFGGVRGGGGALGRQ